jgi:NADH-quinone oxidoreductase subunit G
MVNLTINGKQVSVAPGTTILQACKQAGCQVPTLCYLKDINEIGACRVCIVEVKGLERLVASCNNIVEEGMEIETNSPRVREARRVNVELILSQHDCHCPTCVRNGNCSLQSLAANLGLNTMHYRKEVPEEPWDNDFPLIRDGAKCIKCMRCIQICNKVQGLHIWDIAKTGSRTTVGVSLNRDIKQADCALCGQCITHCPVGALKERDDSRKVFGFRGCLGTHKEKVVVASVAPAVRTAWAEEFGLSRSIATPGRLVAALKAMGFDYVFDTNYAADLTIMEEGSEFLERIKHREDFEYPMFTSCCPGWVRFLKSQYPDMVKDLSTAKSPQQMQGAMVKAYFTKKMNLDPNEVINVSIMPCVAKKAEADIPAMNQGDADKDVDIVLTTRELIRRIRSMNIDVENLPELPFDSPLGNGSGAAVIFGATGGVMEAALRSCYYLATGTNPDPDSFKCVRGLEGWKEANFNVAGIQVKAAIVSGLGNTRRLIEALRRKEVSYDFVEVMACPGGCAGGGGQPIHDGEELAGVRGENLYFLDRNNQMRFSHENPDVLDTYKVLLEKPLSHKAHQLLHTDHEAWEMPLAPSVKR